MLTITCRHCGATLDGLAEYEAHARAGHDRPSYRRMNRETRAIYAATLTADGWLTVRNGEKAMDNRERLAAAVTETAQARDAETRYILIDLAAHLEDTAGDFTDKALAEIAYAYLAGRRDERAGGSQAKPARAAMLALSPLIPAINRVR